mmetsp:Transcript_47907/g.76778  ORF Transcript_47907/g.76778 Transcript_47907/m.76778 type:complete len:225 (-) Transcript_47907:413-1087(-)
MSSLSANPRIITIISISTSTSSNISNFTYHLLAAQRLFLAQISLLFLHTLQNPPSPDFIVTATMITNNTLHSFKPFAFRHSNDYFRCFRHLRYLRCFILLNSIAAIKREGTDRRNKQQHQHPNDRDASSKRILRGDHLQSQQIFALVDTRCYKRTALRVQLQFEGIQLRFMSLAICRNKLQFHLFHQCRTQIRNLRVYNPRTIIRHHLLLSLIPHHLTTAILMW